MKNRKTLLKKITSFMLAVTVFMASLPAIIMPLSAASNDIILGEKTADLSTKDSWKQLFPSDNTSQAGRIWTDKSVFTNADEFQDLVDANGNKVNVDMSDVNNNFLVALSALASNKSIVGYSYTPTDTMLVLDASASMGNSRYVDDLVVAANNAIKKLLNLNKHNRVGVILYSGRSTQGNSSGSTATVLLPLDRYTQSYNIFLVNDGQSSISVNRGVQNKAQQGTDEYMSQTSKNVSGGTYIQNGVYMAMEELLAADTVIPDGQNQAGTTRTPIFVLMSDGEPTAATTNFAGQNNNKDTIGLGTSNLGDGTSVTDNVLADAIDFVNQLTAAYAKAKVDAHYEATTPLFYTLGLGANDSNLDSAVLNPSGFKNTDTLWTEYIGTKDGYSLLIDIEDKNKNPDQTSINKIVEISKADQKNYVTEHFSAKEAEGLINAFDKIVNQIIIQSLYYPTLVDSGDNNNDGFIEFIDDIGHYMEVKDIKGIMIGDTLFTGERIDKNFTPSGGDLIDADGNYTDLGDNMVWSVQQRIGIQNVQDARDLINNAYTYGQLRYNESTGEWSNYIGWYADDAGNYMGFWHEGHTEDDIPEINGVKAAYINRSYGMLGEVTGEHTATDLMYISTQIHTRISNGNVSVIWRVPASLIPVVSYNITLNGETISSSTSATIDYTSAEPIRLLFEVGLTDDINPFNVTEKVTDPEDHTIDKNNDGVSDDGKYYFYTNWWNDDKLSHENPSKVQDTIVFFEPSLQNERYYYSEETPVYINTGTEADPVYTLYNGSKPSKNDGRTYYRRYVVFVGTGDDNTANIKYLYEIMSDETISVLTDTNRNADGTWDIPAGTVHRVLEPYNLEKSDKNLTATLDYVRYPVIEQIPQKNSFYIGSILGNNGRIAVDIPQGIKLTKAVDDTLYGTDYTYKFKIEATNLNGEFTAYIEAADGTFTKTSVEFTNGFGEVTTKAGVNVYILGLPKDTEYTVSEVIGIGETYAVKNITLNGTVIQSTTEASFTLAEYSLAEVGFVNTLKPEPQKGMLVVSKEVIINDPLIEYDSNKVFTFGLYDGETLVGDKFTLADGQSKIIENLEAGKTYTVKEESIPDGFVLEATSVNGISATIEANEVTSAHFVNTYNPEPATPNDTNLPDPANIVVKGTKTLSGRAWKQSDSFEFKLERLDGATWKQIGQTRTVNSSNKEYTFDFGNDADINVSFTAAGEYRFRVSEVVLTNSIRGITYDTDYRYFKVIVTDEDLDGYYEIKSVVAEALATVNSSVKDEVTIWTATADFTNTYAATEGDDLIITIDKTVTDKVGAGTGKSGFLFGLYVKGSTTPIVTADPTDNNGRTAFNLTFPATTVGREYNFEIREIIPQNKINGMIYVTEPYSVTIKVVDNYDGTVRAVVVTSENEVDGITVDFENVYDPADAEVTLKGTKVMDGRDFDANEFTFELYEVGSTVPKLAYNDSKANGGTFTFDTLKFDKIGTYQYTIKERKGTLGGVDYSGKTYNVEIDVSDDIDNDGKLNAKVTIDGTVVSASNFASTVKFINTYTAKSVGVTLEATKTLTGRDLVDGEFKFDLYNADKNYNKGTVAQDDVSFILNGENGKIIFDELTFQTKDTHYYVVVEDENNEKGITADKTEYKVKIVITDPGDGQLEAKVYVNDDEITGSTSQAIVFNNRYDIAPTVIKLEGKKTLTGKNLTENEFSFDLCDKDGKLIETVKNTADGKIQFTEIDIDKADIYTFTVKEVKGSEEGMAYDATVYSVTVTVKDNGDGTFDVDYIYRDQNGAKVDGITFVNTYTPKTPDTPDKPTTPDIPSSPKTGDVSNISLWLALLFINGGCLFGAAIYGKKKAENK